MERWREGCEGRRRIEARGMCKGRRKDVKEAEGWEGRRYGRVKERKVGRRGWEGSGGRKKPRRIKWKHVKASK